MNIENGEIEICNRDGSVTIHSPIPEFRFSPMVDDISELPDDPEDSDYTQIAYPPESEWERLGIKGTRDLPPHWTSRFAAAGNGRKLIWRDDIVDVLTNDCQDVFAILETHYDEGRIVCTRMHSVAEAVRQFAPADRRFACRNVSPLGEMTIELVMEQPASQLLADLGQAA